MSPTPKCSACGAPYMWLLNERTNKPAPIDITPPQGVMPNVVVDGAAYRVVTAGFGTTTSHFATCPAAAKFRGKRR